MNKQLGFLPNFAKILNNNLLCDKRMNSNSINDLLIFRYKNGIQLVNPKHVDKSLSNHKTGFTVKEVLQLPFNFYFLDMQGQTQLMNEESALMCGFQSAEASLGKSLNDVSIQDSAKNLIDNCTAVIEQEILKIFEEENVRKDGVSLNFLSIKCPWYNENKQVVGVFGCSIVMGKHNIADSLAKIIDLGLFDSQQMSLNPKSPNPLKINKNYLSKRELECLHLTIKGYTAKRIARVLDISHRTVEEYLVNIRLKIGANSKSELIEMTIEHFLPEGF